MSDEQGQSGKRTFTEEIDLAGSQIVDQVKKLFAEGNVRQLRIKTAGGELILKTPLTVGALAGGAVTLAAPWLAMLGALAGLAGMVKVEIVRDAEPGKDAAPPPGKTGD